MTSKEALEIIRDYHNQISLLCKGKLNNRIINAENQIEKDLEVLDILKGISSYMSVNFFVKHLTEEKWIKVKEWLINE